MGWLTGWSYRKSITLSRASGAVTNYQMKVLVGESSGATGEDVDCGGKCLSTFNDLRFTTSDGETLLDYWIESISGATPNQLATTWIEFNSIGTGATTFYMYYGKAGAPAVSNGANTFLVFSAFESDTVGVIPAGWSETENAANGTCLTVADGYSGQGIECVCSTITYRADMSITPGTQFCVEARFKAETGYGSLRLGSTGVIEFRYASTQTYFQYLTNDGALWINMSQTRDEQWHKIKMMVYDTNQVDYYLDANAYTGKNIYGLSQSFTELGMRFQLVGTCNLDEIFIRNYRATEPAWGSWGVEEAGAVTGSPYYAYAQQ